MRCVPYIWLLSVPAVSAGPGVRGRSCQAPLEPALHLPGRRLLRAEDEDRARLQVPLVRRVVVATLGENRGSDPAFCLLLHAEADTASEQGPGAALLGLDYLLQLRSLIKGILVLHGSRSCVLGTMVWSCERSHAC